MLISFANLLTTLLISFASYLINEVSLFLIGLLKICSVKTLSFWQTLYKYIQAFIFIFMIFDDNYFKPLNQGSPFSSNISSWERTSCLFTLHSPTTNHLSWKIMAFTLILNLKVSLVLKTRGSAQLCLNKSLRWGERKHNRKPMCLWVRFWSVLQNGKL